MKPPALASGGCSGVDDSEVAWRPRRQAGACAVTPAQQAGLLLLGLAAVGGLGQVDAFARSVGHRGRVVGAGLDGGDAAGVLGDAVADGLALLLLTGDAGGGIAQALAVLQRVRGHARDHRQDAARPGWSGRCPPWSWSGRRGRTGSNGSKRNGCPGRSDPWKSWICGSWNAPGTLTWWETE